MKEATLVDALTKKKTQAGGETVVMSLNLKNVRTVSKLSTSLSDIVLLLVTIWSLPIYMYVCLATTLMIR